MRLVPREEPREARARRKARRERYAAAAGERLRAASDCQFSLLPYEELARTAALWYDACAEAVLKGNYVSLDNLVRHQARVAAKQGFTLADLLELLRLCRQVAIEKEGWNEDQFAEVDAVIDEALGRLRPDLVGAWTIPEGLNYLTGKSHAHREQEERAPATKAAERRTHGRSKLRLLIRVRGLLASGPVDETTRTENVAKGGIYFLSRNAYFKGMNLQVTYPYWDTPGAINKEYPAEVVRIEERGNTRGVAVKFLVSLGKPTPRA